MPVPISRFLNTSEMYPRLRIGFRDEACTNETQGFRDYNVAYAVRKKLSPYIESQFLRIDITLLIIISQTLFYVS